MKKNIFLLIAAFTILSLGFTSCAEDTEAVDPYADWQGRNEHYLDSIVDVARTNADGSWEIYRNYKVQTDNSTAGGGIDGTSITNPYETPADETDSVYVRVIKAGDGITPLYTDSVTVYYRGSLINGTVFDQNFQGELDTDVHTPTTFALQSSGYDGLVNGWITALQHMQEGEHVMLYIPSDLAYGASGRENVPGHSVLIFEMLLEKVIHPKGIEDRSRVASQQENE